MGRIGKQIGRRAEAMNNTCLSQPHAGGGCVLQHYPDLRIGEEQRLPGDPSFPPRPRPTRSSAKRDRGLGPTGILVNVARGAWWMRNALVEALTSGKLGGAGLDVFVNEPKVPEVLFWHGQCWCCKPMSAAPPMRPAAP